MYKARYYKADGKKGRARALPEVLFDGVVNESVMHQVVKAYLSNQRQGTAAAKSRGQVAGGARKPWRQKGTGRARQGTIRAVQWTGGGVAFPPIPHGWRQRVPKKVKALARRSALNDRAESDRLLLADLPEFEKPKTRDLVGFLRSIEAEGKVLILTEGVRQNLHLSARNLQDVNVLPFGDESVYDVLWAQTVIIERSAIDSVDTDETEEAAEEEESAAAKAEASAAEKTAEPAAEKAEKAAAKKDAKATTKKATKTGAKKASTATEKKATKTGAKKTTKATAKKTTKAAPKKTTKGAAKKTTKAAEVEAAATDAAAEAGEEDDDA